MMQRFKSLNISDTLAVLVIATLFLKENFNSAALILFSIFFIIQMFHSKKNGVVNVLKKGGIYLGYFLLACLGCLLNEESNYDYLTRLLPFVLSLFFIFYFNNNADKKIIIIKVFVISLIVFLLFLDFYALWDMYKAKSLFVIENGRENYRFLYTRFTKEYFNHIYLSVYCLFGLVAVFNFAVFQKRILRYIVAAFFLFHIVIMTSRAVVLAILISAILMLIYLSFTNMKYLKYFFIFIGVLGVFSAIVYQRKDSVLFNRYSQLFHWYQNRDLLLQRDYSINNRAKLYIVGYSMFKDGERYGINGTGLASDEIKKKYLEDYKAVFSFKTDTYNPHNQFITNFIDWGILGLLLTFIIVITPLIYCVNNKLYWGIFFWLAFILTLLMESMLIRHRGIVFFIIFSTLYITTITTNEKRNKSLGVNSGPQL